MEHVVWSGTHYESVHQPTCGHLGKNQPGPWQDDPAYTRYESREAAERAAEATGRTVCFCSTCL